MLTTEKERKTAADYAKLPDGKERYELIDGELIMVPAPTFEHQDISGFLHGKLEALVRPRKLGKVVSAPTDVHATEHDVYQPDILFIRRNNLGIVKEGAIYGAPDLIIEILSPSTGYYDLKHKKDVYQQIGVQEYWIVDPMDKTVECFLNSPRGYETFFLGKKNGTAQSSLLPEFSIDLGELFSL
ncbi:MAG TPA: Uma2 family endonuclease [Candidatus Kapabacteria bacterium]|nr:Uma2 family endonuclease [Candidatus Kapabacteria bacterium]